MTNITIFKNISIVAAVMTLNAFTISNSQAATILKRKKKQEA